MMNGYILYYLRDMHLLMFSATYMKQTELTSQVASSWGNRPAKRFDIISDRDNTLWCPFLLVVCVVQCTGVANDSVSEKPRVWDGCALQLFQFA